MAGNVPAQVRFACTILTPCWLSVSCPTCSKTQQAPHLKQHTSSKCHPFQQASKHTPYDVICPSAAPEKSIQRRNCHAAIVCHTVSLTCVWSCCCVSVCRAATAKWCSGRLTISATINGHSGPVTCIDVLDNTVITGSSDGTACVWNLANSTQQQQLQMPGKEAVVAVALPSISLAVTATAKGGAVLWRAGKAIRRFQVMPVSHCLGLSSCAC